MMKAEKKIWCDGKRERLADVLPLSTPISISYEVSSYCNLRCNYCAHGAKEKAFPQMFLDMDLFKKSVDSLKQFPQKIKNILFAVNGEPLTNPQVPEMIAYIKSQNVAEQVTLFTNAVLLTPEMGKRLVDAGLDLLRLSIQGITSAKYRELCGTPVDFEMLLGNVRTFYENKGNCRVFAKIVDKSFDEPGDEQTFYRLFGDICDEISVELIVPIRMEVDYEGVCGKGDKNMLKQEIVSCFACPQPFYAMYVRSNGNVTPCCLAASNSSLIVGNIRESGLDALWRSDVLWQIRKMQLARQRFSHPVCSTCNGPTYSSPESDRIDGCAPSLLTHMAEERE